MLLQLISRRHQLILSEGGWTLGAPMVITWQPVTCEFAASGTPAKPGGGAPQQDAMEDELEP